LATSFKSKKAHSLYHGMNPLNIQRKNLNQFKRFNLLSPNGFFFRLSAISWIFKLKLPDSEPFYFQYTYRMATDYPSSPLELL